jgi:hypothetical protein
MPSLFLFTFLSCSQVQVVSNQLQNIAMLTPQQKKEIAQELKKVVPSCPIIIQKND